MLIDIGQGWKKGTTSLAQQQKLWFEEEGYVLELFLGW